METVMKRKKLTLKYIDEFKCYGIKMSDIHALKMQSVAADIALPEDFKVPHKQPTIGFLLGVDTSISGEQFYTIGENYLHAVLNSGVNIRFLDFESTQDQLKDCDGLILPGGSFNNPESFYIDEKIMTDHVEDRYKAYEAAIQTAHKLKMPMLGICAGAQMIGVLLGGMKMYRSVKKEVPHPDKHKPKEETDLLLHQIKLMPNTKIFGILNRDEKDDLLLINSRHAQAMVHDYIADNPAVEMTIYAISSHDKIPEIWGNDAAGILCVQGHPEDLIAQGNQEMQEIYNYLSIKAEAYHQRSV